jgi:hypothetical protein
MIARTADVTLIVNAANIVIKAVIFIFIVHGISPNLSPSPLACF